jgi:hypothetical protein
VDKEKCGLRRETLTVCQFGDEHHLSEIFVVGNGLFDVPTSVDDAGVVPTEYLSDPYETIPSVLTQIHRYMSD